MTVLDFEPPFEGRTADLLAFHTSSPYESAKVEQTLLNGKGGAMCTGIQKLAQQVVLRLFTRVSGQPYEASEGCQLVTEILQNTLHTVADVRRSFEQSREDILNQFALDLVEHPDIPADEQLFDLQWLDGQIQAGDLYLNLQVVSQAGDTLTFIVPITASS